MDGRHVAVQRFSSTTTDAPVKRFIIAHDVINALMKMTPKEKKDDSLLLARSFYPFSPVYTHETTWFVKYVYDCSRALTKIVTDDEEIHISKKKKNV